MAQPPSQAWSRWKSLRLPWRKWFLCGHDLSGNTFWEFRQTLSQQTRMRRIVKYPTQVAHSDVQVTPAWMQWLRHTRQAPPTEEEQQQDVLRQQRIKLLAQEADRRWAAQPSYLVPPDSPAALGADLQETARMMLPEEAKPSSHDVGAQATGRAEEKIEAKGSPWNQASKKMDEPQPWSPTTAKRR